MNRLPTTNLHRQWTPSAPPKGLENFKIRHNEKHSSHGSYLPLSVHLPRYERLIKQVRERPVSCEQRETEIHLNVFTTK